MTRGSLGPISRSRPPGAGSQNDCSSCDRRREREREREVLRHIKKDHLQDHKGPARLVPGRFNIVQCCHMELPLLYPRITYSGVSVWRRPTAARAEDPRCSQRGALFLTSRPGPKYVSDVLLNGLRWQWRHVRSTQKFNICSTIQFILRLAPRGKGRLSVCPAKSQRIVLGTTILCRQYPLTALCLLSWTPAEPTCRPLCSRRHTHTHTLTCSAIGIVHAHGNVLHTFSRSRRRMRVVCGATGLRGDGLEGGDDLMDGWGNDPEPVR